MYGMTSTGGYVTQYSRHLERDMSRNKTSVGDYYARKAEMLKILMTDNDSGESCTRGKLQQDPTFQKILLLNLSRNGLVVNILPGSVFYWVRHFILTIYYSFCVTKKIN